MEGRGEILIKIISEEKNNGNYKDDYICVSTSTIAGFVAEYDEHSGMR